MDELEKLRKNIQKQLGIIRKNKKLTQEELACKIGITSKSLSDIETGRRNLSFKTFLKLCQVLDIDIYECLKGKINE